VQNYTPTTHPVNAFKASLRLAFSQAYHGEPLEGPIVLRALFLLPRPARLIWSTRPMPREPHAKKPDKDNLEKALKDALTKLAWRDDAQVFDGRVKKLYAAGDESPGVYCEIEALGS
jgi:Holliday junction resolvase RusA-like endonuclease